MWPIAAGGLPKTTFKSGLASTASGKGRPSSSPQSSPPRQSGAPASPFGTGSITKSHVSTEDIMPTQMKSKENTASSEKDISTRATSAVWEPPGCKGNLGAKPMDLQSMLINLLIQNPKGMSLKVWGFLQFLNWIFLSWYLVHYLLLLRFVLYFHRVWIHFYN